MVTTPGKIALGIALVAMSIALLGNVTTLAKAQDNCQKIERLNTRVRDNAEKMYVQTQADAKERVAKLDEEARLLGITVTPELRQRVAQDAQKEVDRAKEERDFLVAQYAREACSFLGS